MANKLKNINYLNQDFATFKQQLINYSKTYFPNSYNDFSESSPGTIFIEMASYVGDVLSFYLDTQIQETFIQYAQQESNLFSLAYMLGYRPKVTQASGVDLTFQQQVPSILDGGVYYPDFNYALTVSENLQISNGNNVTFIIQNTVDFTTSSSYDPTSVTTYLVNDGIPERFLLTKHVKAISATVQSKTFTFGDPTQFITKDINSSNLIGILDVTDSDGNIWYEVDYLAQDVVFDKIRNTNANDPNFSNDSTDTPYLLKLKQADRRFVSRFINATTLQLQFGSGVVSNNDETIVPNPDNVGLGLPFEQNKLTTAFSPSNFIFTDSYGISPSNTTLTVRYLIGGGTTSNVQSNTLTTITNANSQVNFIQPNINPTLAQTIFDSLSVTNLAAASGGGDGDSLEEIRQNSTAQFQSQLRTVTQDDYLVRSLSLPSIYGSVAKVYATAKLASDISKKEQISAVDLYCLAYNNQRQLVTPSLALKNNLKTYLSQYRMINDTVDIKNGYIVNIGVDFDIIVLPNYNSNEVILSCITAFRQFFNINNWQMNQPIILRDLYSTLDQVSGVQTVKNITISNKAGVASGYSAFGYDINGATIDGVVYPSIDPSIFEVKYPNTDIKGRVVSY